jgi:glycosyltransferase involved in cell wall biosynthesis
VKSELIVVNKSRPKVSIGMPVYNGERYLPQALNSILSQTFQDYELIISDNASADATEKICKSYCAKDSRIQYYRNSENIGASNNYCRVFDLSKGAYFRWANHDDLFLPGSLARCVKVLDENPSVILAYPKTKLIDEKGNIISKYEDNMNLQSCRPSERFVKVWEQLGLVNIIYGLIRSEVIQKTALIGDFIGADPLFVSELSLHGKFQEIPEHLFFRRIHPDAYSSETDEKKMIQFYRPNKTLNFQMTNCRHICEAFAAVKRAKLDLAEQVKIYKYIGKMVNWRRREIAQELLNAVKYSINVGVYLKSF